MIFKNFHLQLWN